VPGVKGRSGRKRKPLADHVRNGTYRPDRHGPLPAGGRAAVVNLPVNGANALQPAPADPPDTLLEGLAAPGRAIVCAIWREFEGGPAEQVLLRAAAEGWDTVQAARAQIAVDGLVRVSDRGVERVHPLVKVERQAVQQVIACLRALGLPAPEVK